MRTACKLSKPARLLSQCHPSPCVYLKPQGQTSTRGPGLLGQGISESGQSKDWSQLHTTGVQVADGPSFPRGGLFHVTSSPFLPPPTDARWEQNGQNHVAPGKLTVLKALLAQRGKNWPGLPKVLGWFEDKDKDPQRCTWGWGRIAITFFILMPHLTPQRMCGRYIHTCPTRYNE